MSFEYKVIIAAVLIGAAAIIYLQYIKPANEKKTSKEIPDTSNKNAKKSVEDKSKDAPSVHKGVHKFK